MADPSPAWTPAPTTPKPSSDTPKKVNHLNPGRESGDDAGDFLQEENEQAAIASGGGVAVLPGKPRKPRKPATPKEPNK